MIPQIIEKVITENYSFEDKTIVKIKISEATFEQAEEFKNSLEELVMLGNSKLILDFSKCTFIDSTFLGVIAIVLKSLRNVSGDLKIVADGNFTRAIMTTNGINRAVEICESVEEALASF